MAEDYTNDRIDRPSGLMPDEFDRVLDALSTANHVVKVEPKTLRQMPMFGLGGSTSFNVQMVRVRDTMGEDRHVLFLEIGKGGQLHRFVLGDDVLDTIARMRDRLSTKLRKTIARATMKERMASGWRPDFGGKRGVRKARKKRRRATMKSPPTT